MKTIIQPKQHIAALWSIPSVISGQSYRLMHYVMRLDYNCKTLLHNVVTGQLVVLDQAEIKLLENLPKSYNPVMNQLIESHYLVTDTYDEHQQVIGIRQVLQKINDKYQESGITQYTILPTTACNARCFYCYEQGLKTMTMSEETANDVIRFISTHCEGKKVNIRWFGGEPTVALQRIDQICEGLRNQSIEFMSRMTTNAYLLDERLVARIKQEWNLQEVMISLDGSERNYNRIKSYINANDNPYQRVLQNIGFLLNQKIQVKLRMNFDSNNYLDFDNLLDDIEKRYKNNPYLQVRPHQINPHYPDADLVAFLQNKQWINDTMMEMEDLLSKRGFSVRDNHLPSLEFHLCGASNSSTIVIIPDGSLVKCPDLLDCEQIIGNVKQGITNNEKVLSWRIVSDYEHCHECLLFPECIIVANCKSGKECLFKAKKIHNYHNRMIELYHSYIDRQSATSVDTNTSEESYDCLT